VPTLPRSSQALVDEALAQVTTVDVAEALRLRRDEGALLVDLREAVELETEGSIPGAHHAPRGLLEFVIDPQSAWHDPAFADATRTYVLFCGIGWRSALAARTMQQMGFARVVHLGGGFAAWKAVDPA
jgi:rhodanese-related sulfurtransferase